MPGSWIAKQAGLTVWLLGLLLACGGASAAAPIGLRPYITLRAGGALFADPQHDPDLVLGNPSQYPFTQLGVGVDLSRHFGVELAVDHAETDLKLSSGLRLGEYSFWAVLGQGRVRYPLWRDRLVPYAVAGLGLGFGEFNDREIRNIDIAFRGSQDFSPVAGIGLGLDYFVASNLALGAQAKHVFLFDTDVVLGDQTKQLDLDSTFLSVGFRLYFGDGAPGADHRKLRPAADSDRRRGYAAFRTGGAILADPDADRGVGINSPTHTNFGVNAGLNLDRHWGVELAGEYYETTLSAPGVGDFIEYALWTYLGLIRYRYPLWQNRLVPYVLAGGGIGTAQINDRRVPTDRFDADAKTFTPMIGAVGGGIESFIANNAALGLEICHLFGFTAASQWTVSRWRRTTTRPW